MIHHLAPPTRVPSRIVLDTSSYARFRAGDERVVDWIAGCDLVYLPVTVLGELEAGFRLGRRYEENVLTLEAFLSEPFVEAVSVTPDVALRYGQLFATLRRAGTPIPVNDIWIAATALEVGAQLLSFDAHFDRVEGLGHTLLT